MELQVWQPVTCLVKGNIIGATFQYFDTEDQGGLKIVLTDIKGTMVEVIYDKHSPIVGDCVWTFRYANEIARSDLNKFIDRADHSKLTDPAAHHFYKALQSDYIAWYDQLPWLGSEDAPHVEHHIYMYNDGVFEVISDYEPRFIVKKQGDGS